MVASSLKLTAAPAAPDINKVEPFVWVVGATNQITIEGKELGTVRGLWTSRHGVLDGNRLTAAIEDEGERLKLSVPIDLMLASGPFAMRLITDGGISAPVMAMLEGLPELKPGPDKAVNGAGFINGLIEGDKGVRFQIPLKKHDEFMMDVSAGRFGSKLDPVLRITDPKGNEVAFVQDTPGLGIDCWATFCAPTRGNYLVEIRDAGYGSGRDYRYHLRLGESAGGFSGARVHGSEDVNLMRFGGQVSMSRSESDKFDKFFTDFAANELVHKPLGMAVGSGRLIGMTPLAQERYGIGPVAAYPVAGIPPRNVSGHFNAELDRHLSLNGWFSSAGEVHRLELKVMEPAHWRYIAMSRRFGGGCDPVMRIKDEDGKTLVASHMFSNESVLSWNCKEAGDYLLEIWDAAGQSGPNAAFHIQAQENPAEFELNTETDSVRIPAGGEGELNVTIDRDGYDGPVKFELAHGPEGVELADAVAKEKSKEAKFKIKLAASLAPGTTFPLKISGRRGEGENAPKAPLYTSAYWKKRFPDLYSPMFEFEDAVWVTVLKP